MEYCYRASGLVIRSEIEIPELCPCSEDSENEQVTIKLSRITPLAGPTPGRGIFFHATPGEFFLDLPTVARYWVRNGSQISIDPSTQPNWETIRLFLFNTPLVALLLQRDEFLIHASVISTPKGAVAFAGHSGAGKSALAAAFHLAGYSILADDICLVRFSETGSPLVLPAFQRIYLWQDVINHLEIPLTSLIKARPGINKYGLPLANFPNPNQVFPLRAIYTLSRVSAVYPRIENITGASKLIQLLTYQHCQRINRGLGVAKEVFTKAGQAARRVPVRRILFPTDKLRLNELRSLVEADLENQGNLLL